MVFASDENKLATSLPASCLVYLFGDLFVRVGRVAPWVREPLPWRGDVVVHQGALAKAILISAVISLADSDQIRLGLGLREHLDTFLLGFFAKNVEAVLMDKVEGSSPVEGLVEKEILRRLEALGQLSLYQALKDMIPFGYQVREIVLGMVKHDLKNRGLLWEEEKGRWWGLRRTVQVMADQGRVEGLTAEAAKLQQAYEHFQREKPRFYNLLDLDIEAVIRVNLDRAS
ncbi:MAG: hypothetical protein ACE5NP_12780 [Anaerolineae bacterium]